MPNGSRRSIPTAKLKSNMAANHSISTSFQLNDIGRKLFGSSGIRSHLDDPISSVRGVGQARASSFMALGIETVDDILWYLPRRYVDFSTIKPIEQVIAGETVTVMGEVISVEVKQSARDRRLWLNIARVRDDTGTIDIVFFMRTRNAKMRPRFSMAPSKGALVYVSGVVQHSYGRLAMVNPDFEEIHGARRDEQKAGPTKVSAEDELLSTGRVVPIYGLTRGLGQRTMRKIVSNTLKSYSDELDEVIPIEILARHGLPERHWSFANVHFPRNLDCAEEARRRLAFEELFLLRLALRLRRSQYRVPGSGMPCISDGDLVRRFRGLLPFNLTRAQERVIGEIRDDMERDVPMSRLIQGDVGSGKTIVAAFAIVKAVESGYQAALMAPTEILAEQHRRSLERLLQPLGISIISLTGGLSARERNLSLAEIGSGASQVVIGTHALIQDDVTFKRLGLVVTDEQHRFGVNQRIMLASKGENPHVLVMSATPIPRTLALVVYGDLDISIIDELPPGRTPIETHWVKPSGRSKVYDFIRGQVASGRQAYIVCPLIEESEDMDARAATAEAERLKAGVFRDMRVGLLHGKMGGRQKEEVMRQFRDGKLDVLISTTVIEVGVDVPNATVMVIEDADRFGLAELHQLRGRVGRGPHRSYCILIARADNPVSRQRLQAIQRTTDGFLIAEEDLRLRGPGELFGVRQHGIPDLRVDISTKDLSILESAAAAALEIDIDELSPGRCLERLGREVFRRFISLLPQAGA
ncbi:MAG: ATP-dependent DNA helicase RecG [Firmicutes bacterium]|nr:ATP-dependent DNA helicase RecG [Bacillota bacterium]